ncbi:MAG: hypothetical protein HY094_02605 [Candidatus Melainabacteria bacterium]|nr:hypothetical protein [Candidatus Melainabacteria bacterium]
MYRLSGPKIYIFAPILIIGVFVVAFIPAHFGVERSLSFSALVLGEAGLSFIPVLALYPKATPFQAALLAVIYFFTTFIICFIACGINNLGWPGTYAFLLRDGEFTINTHALFTANIFSLAALFLDFKLIYDEELTKSFHNKQKAGYKKAFGFMSFQKPLLRQPTFEQPRKTSSSTSTKKETSKKKSKIEDPFEDDFLKPFEFEPETTQEEVSLPEESSGKLYSPEVESAPKISDFFDDAGISGTSSKVNIPKENPQEPHSRFFEDEKTEEVQSKDFINPFPSETPTVTEFEKPKQIQTTASPFPPSNIKDDLQAIFEQYSSLNAVKKLTANKPEKTYSKKKLHETVHEKLTRKPYESQKETSQISASINTDDIHEATYRQVSEEEKLQDIKEELKKELEEKFQAKLVKETQNKEEVIQKASDSKEEIIQSIQSVKDTLKKEFEDKLQNRLDEEAKRREESIQKTSETKEEIIQSIESIKGALKKEFEDKLQSRLDEEAKRREESIQKASDSKEEII